MILLLVVWEDLGADISPGDSRETTDSPSSSKVGPTIRALERIASNVTSRQCLDSNLWDIVLEGDLSVHGKAHGEDQDKSSSRHASSNLSSISRGTGKCTQWSELDEWTDQQESVGKSDLNTSQEWRHSGAVGWEVGQIAGHERRRGDWSLEHSDEWISVDWLDNLHISVVVDECEFMQGYHRGSGTAETKQNLLILETISNPIRSNPVETGPHSLEHHSFMQICLISYTLTMKYITTFSRFQGITSDATTPSSSSCRVRTVSEDSIGTRVSISDTIVITIPEPFQQQRALEREQLLRPCLLEQQQISEHAR
jgi:hypothetical protein